MSDELRAAVERLSDPNPTNAYPWPCDMHEQPAQRAADMALVVRHYLAAARPASPGHGCEGCGVAGAGIARPADESLLRAAAERIADAGDAADFLDDYEATRDLLRDATILARAYLAARPAERQYRFTDEQMNEPGPVGTAAVHERLDRENCYRRDCDVPWHARPADDAKAGWRPIETAPRDGRRLMLSDAAKEDVYEGRWLTSPNQCRWVAFCYELDEVAPTHWQPLPVGATPVG